MGKKRSWKEKESQKGILILDTGVTLCFAYLLDKRFKNVHSNPRGLVFH